jgi:hypothetical protein
MPDYQIILLPRESYYDWVAAARDYVMKFGANLTPDPDSAGRYMTPQQVVTIAGLPGGYPAHGDIQAWFQKNYPSIRVDYVPAKSPDEFKAALQARIAANDRYGQGGEAFKLLWPSDYPKVILGFGANPEVFRRDGFPGHEGLDIRAPSGAKVYACADGTVTSVDVYKGNRLTQPYGTSVEIQHRDGYRTLYGHLGQVSVKPGAVVKAGQAVGLAGASGNTPGGYVHLTLKKQGATAARQTNYPNDIVDPTPFIEWPSEATPSPEPPPAISYPWPPGVCLAGLHGRTDGRMQESDFTVVREARVEAVKLMSTAAPEDVDRLRAINPGMFVLVRLFISLKGRSVSGAQFAQDIAHEMGQFYQRGVRWFEVHNEANLVDEGWTTAWQNGRDFGQWFLEAAGRLRALYPEAKFGYPGLSPDGFPMPQRTNDLKFMEESDEAVRAADWIGVHCYWRDEAEMMSPSGGMGWQEIRRRYPDKLLFITEFSNPAEEAQTKAHQYVRYYQALRHKPGLGAAFAFVVSASSGFVNEVWRDEGGNATAIPGIIRVRAD